MGCCCDKDTLSKTHFMNSHKISSSHGGNINTNKRFLHGYTMTTINTPKQFVANFDLPLKTDEERYIDRVKHQQRMNKRFGQFDILSWIKNNKRLLSKNIYQSMCN